MTGIDQARDQLRSVLTGLTEPLRPQDAASLAAGLAYLTPVIASLTGRIDEQLAQADRLPGLYSTTGGDARDELRQARAQLSAARRLADELVGVLDAAHNVLAAIGHGDTTDQPLTVVDQDPDHTSGLGWKRVDDDRRG